MKKNVEDQEQFGKIGFVFEDGLVQAFRLERKETSIRKPANKEKDSSKNY